MNTEREENQPLDKLLKETPSLRQALDGVRKAVAYWYPVISGEVLSILTPENIIFLGEEEFLRLQQANQAKGNLILMALAINKIPAEEVFPEISSDFKGRLTYASPLVLPGRIYFCADRFGSFLDQDKHQEEKNVLGFGITLINQFFFVLPQKQEASKEAADYFFQILQKALNKAFDEAKTREGVLTSSPGLIEGVRHFFWSLMEIDNTRKIVFHGATPILTCEFDGQDCMQIAVAEDLSSGIAGLLSQRVEKTFVDFWASHYGISPSAKEKVLQTLRQEEIDGFKRRQEAEAFLNKLKLVSYLDIFEAFQSSKIPLIFLQRLKTKPNLQYPD